MPKPLVLMDHDGGVDDFASLILLMTMNQLRPLGIVVTPADCYIQPAVSATRKILDLMGRAEVPVAESTVRGRNAFPRIWRKDSYRIDHLPILNQKDIIRTRLAAENGQEFMARVLEDSLEPVTLLVTGPLTNLATALEHSPEIEGSIESVVWMGGALNVAGGGMWMESGQDGSMEWNAYWDPPAVHRVWQSSIPIVLCPLDITETVPCTPEFVQQLGRQRRHSVSDLAGQCYALVMHQKYYFWDVLTTTFLDRPDLFELREWETVTIPEGPSQGRIKIEEGGRMITALHKVDVEGFYAYLLDKWASG